MSTQEQDNQDRSYDIVQIAYDLAPIATFGGLAIGFAGLITEQAGFTVTGGVIAVLGSMVFMDKHGPQTPEEPQS